MRKTDWDHSCLGAPFAKGKSGLTIRLTCLQSQQLEKWGAETNGQAETSSGKTVTVAAKMHRGKNGICVGVFKLASQQLQRIFVNHSTLIYHLTYLQGIEEDEISFARELFPKTRQHGVAIGIRLKDDLDFEENEEEVKMSVSKRLEEEGKYEEKEEREYEEEEETSARESELSSASDSVSLEVCDHLKSIRNL